MLLNEKELKNKTNELVKNHPLNEGEIVKNVLKAWENLSSLKFINDCKFQMYEDIFLSPGAIGDLLQDLITKEIEYKFPKKFRSEIPYKKEKDLVCITNDKYSIEIKTTRNKGNTFPSTAAYVYNGKNKKRCIKVKCGYFLGVKYNNEEWRINKIKFGWIDQDDWNIPKAKTSGASSLKSFAFHNKLKTIYGE